MQETLFPELVATSTGIVYLMTDGYLLKFGYSSRGTPKPRSGELRATVIGFMPGTRADERAYLDSVKRWSVGGEWFRVPDDPDALAALMTTTRLMGQWKGVRAADAVLRVIAANLRRAA
jgi:hypothetical protein